MIYTNFNQLQDQPRLHSHTSSTSLHQLIYSTYIIYINQFQSTSSTGAPTSTYLLQTPPTSLPLHRSCYTGDSLASTHLQNSYSSSSCKNSVFWGQGQPGPVHRSAPLCRDRARRTHKCAVTWCFFHTHFFCARSNESPLLCFWVGWLFLYWPVSRCAQSKVHN